MRVVLLILVLANAALFAYAWLDDERAAARSRIAALELNAEKIRILRAGGAPEPGRPRAARAAPAACLEWGLFAGPQAARAEGALAALELSEGSVARSVSEAPAYWIYVPPLKTRAEVERKIGELKALGVNEFFVVQEPAPWRNAISLGLFRSEEAAKARFGELQQRGVRTALLERREGVLKQVAFVVREPDEATVKKLAELQKQFPGSELKAVACPPAAAGQG
jgi:hypothetical protein